MDKLSENALKILKSLHAKIYPESSNFGRNWKIMPAKDYANNLIFNSLLEDKPTMIARIGSTELACMVNYLGVKSKTSYTSLKGYITNQTPPWWWNKSILEQMHNWSGFFPSNEKNAEKFCDLMISNLEDIDILGSWLKEESFFKPELSTAKKVMLEDLEPFFCRKPWTSVLEGKRVLVVHPFDQTIQHQFSKREKLFDNNLLPDFELITVKAVQTIAKEATPFASWFDALDHMKEEISTHDYDICILGCGAYGLPLASFIKKAGKKAVHLGGVTQILFGIKGKRWENYIVYPYTNLYNDAWIRPGENEKPKNANVVEGACYW